MKRLIIPDVHQRDPQEFVDYMIKHRGIEHISCLGDIEDPDITEYLLNLDFPKAIVIGNHDYPFMVDSAKILSGVKVNRKEKPDYLGGSVEDYWKKVDKWTGSKTLGEFALNMISDYDNEQRFQIEENSKNGRIAYVHASIFDFTDIEPNVISEGPYQLWGYMQSRGKPKDYMISGNFEAMSDPYGGYDIMFRGHDFGQRLYSLENKSQTHSDFHTFENPNEKIQVMFLSPKRKHIVSAGSYRHGQYAVFDDESLMLELHNPEG